MARAARRPPIEHERFRRYVDVLEHLGLKTEALVIVEPRGGTRIQPDARLRLRGDWGRGEWWGELKARLPAAALAPTVDQMKALEAAGRPALLFTEHITPPMAEELRRHDVQFVDAAGNAFVRDRGLLIWVTGRKPDPPARGGRRELHVAGIRLLYVLLRGLRAGVTQRELAQDAGVALGGVGRLLRDFERRGWIRKAGADARALEQPATMLARWEDGYAVTLRAKLHVATCRRGPAVELAAIPDRIVAADLRERILVGGELGAALLTDYLKPVTATLHVDETDTKLVMQRLGLVPDPKGDVELVRHIGRTHAPTEPADVAVGLADPLLLRAELLVEHDDRLREVAELLRRDHIEPRWR